MTDVGLPQVFRIVRVGLRAARLLRVETTWRVCAVFEASFYIADDAGGFVGVGAASIGNGPLTAVCAAAPDAGWRAAGVREGQTASVNRAGIGLAGGPAFDLSSAATWVPTPWPTMPPAGALRASLDALQALATQRAPHDGLARIVFGGSPAGGLAHALQRTAGRRTATVRDWLAERHAGSDELDAAGERAVHGLLGLGPGLTPSGDDVIAGLLVALHATGSTHAATRLAAFVHTAPADATSPLARAFLGAAIAGEPGEAMHAMLSALLAGDHAALAPALDRLDGIGHTSGWDMLAGVVIGLEAVGCRVEPAAVLRAS